MRSLCTCQVGNPHPKWENIGLPVCQLTLGKPCPSLCGAYQEIWSQPQIHHPAIPTFSRRPPSRPASLCRPRSPCRPPQFPPRSPTAHEKSASTTKGGTMMMTMGPPIAMRMATTGTSARKAWPWGLRKLQLQQQLQHWLLGSPLIQAGRGSRKRSSNSISNNQLCCSGMGSPMRRLACRCSGISCHSISSSSFREKPRSATAS
mmetsp:Transcript_52182/g.113652  ORF Transcript_52182/g.113652 Transcript_52182/m.113652 type:complete len:204 (-) Transcript_52182:264-875(-)